MNVHPSAPIGVFDSGLGGLSVVRQLQVELPRESILYAADSRFCPYGERSLNQIQERTIAMVGYLVECGAKLVIVACNTASAAAIEVLREHFRVPIVALEPAVKPAVALTRSGKIAVLATPSTAGSTRLRELITRYGSGYDIRPIGVPGLADCVEAGVVDGPAVRELLAELVRGQVRAGVDVIVLGCTHYPFVSHVVEELAGHGVRIVDSGNAIARRAREVLMQAGLLRGIESTPTLTVHTTGDPGIVGPVIARMIGAGITVSNVGALEATVSA
jgi:glutamate racemase